jgi:hypothetical protein
MIKFHALAVIVSLSTLSHLAVAAADPALICNNGAHDRHRLDIAAAPKSALVQDRAPGSFADRSVPWPTLHRPGALT